MRLVSNLAIELAARSTDVSRMQAGAVGGAAAGGARYGRGKEIRAGGCIIQRPDGAIDTRTRVSRKSRVGKRPPADDPARGVRAPARKQLSGKMDGEPLAFPVRFERAARSIRDRRAHCAEERNSRTNKRLRAARDPRPGVGNRKIEGKNAAALFVPLPRCPVALDDAFNQAAGSCTRPVRFSPHRTLRVSCLSPLTGLLNS